MVSFYQPFRGSIRDLEVRQGEVDTRVLVPRSSQKQKKIGTMFTLLRIRGIFPGSWIRIFFSPGSQIPDLGSQIPDPRTTAKEEGDKKISCLTYFYSHKFHESAIFFNEQVQNKI
jgi:hypothetical protein